MPKNILVKEEFHEPEKEENMTNNTQNTTKTPNVTPILQQNANPTPRPINITPNVNYANNQQTFWNNN